MEPNRRAYKTKSKPRLRRVQSNSSQLLGSAQRRVQEVKENQRTVREMGHALSSRLREQAVCRHQAVHDMGGDFLLFYVRPHWFALRYQDPAAGGRLETLVGQGDAV